MLELAEALFDILLKALAKGGRFLAWASGQAARRFWTLRPGQAALLRVQATHRTEELRGWIARRGDEPLAAAGPLALRELGRFLALNAGLPFRHYAPPAEIERLRLDLLRGEAPPPALLTAARLAVPSWSRARHYRLLRRDYARVFGARPDEGLWPRRPRW